MATLQPSVGPEDTARNLAVNRSYRLTAVDFLRGLVIIIMAIDHVRDFFLAGTSADPTTDPNISAGLFATRWITHFCARSLCCSLAPAPA